MWLWENGFLSLSLHSLIHRRRITRLSKNCSVGLKQRESEQCTVVDRVSVLVLRGMDPTGKTPFSSRSIRRILCVSLESYCYFPCINRVLKVFYFAVSFVHVSQLLEGRDSSHPREALWLRAWVLEWNVGSHCGSPTSLFRWCQGGKSSSTLLGLELRVLWIKLTKDRLTGGKAYDFH